jgi:ketosteroid isomerase-like protein
MGRLAAVLAALVCMGTPVFGQGAVAPIGPRVLEIRSYNLQPGTRDRFHQLFLREALPMLRRWRIDVVAFGPSLHDADSYFLMRGFSGVEARSAAEDAFYASDEWRKGPRDAVLSLIVNYTTVVIRMDEDALGGLRRTMSEQKAIASDLDTLLSLNADYIRAVQQSDVSRFEQMLADDFLCSLPDGTLLDRARFLQHAARPPAIANLAVYDVNVRLMGDIAIVHARTTFTLPNGQPGEGRYTDVWARRNGGWLAVAAHVTRK